MLTRVNSLTVVSARGFTLFELIIVILLIGVISVTVAPKWVSTPTNVNYEANRVLNDIRYAQALSLTRGIRYRWVYVSATSYQILNESGVAIILPTGGTTLTLTSGTTISGLTNLPNNFIAFDSQGIPYTTSSIPGTALAATASITLTGGGATRTVQISPQTGYGVVS